MFETYTVTLPPENTYHLHAGRMAQLRQKRKNQFEKVGTSFDLKRVRLDRTSDTPLHLQLADAVSVGVQSGALKAGVELPSTRCLALALKTSRNTVVHAYEELASRG